MSQCCIVGRSLSITQALILCILQVPGKLQMDKGWISVWVKMASLWVCSALYTWTLIAPAILRNRDFS